MAFTLFSAKMQNLIKEKGFIEPTLPQKMGIPEILKGSDVLIISPTGMGKTRAKRDASVRAHNHARVAPSHAHGQEASRAPEERALCRDRRDSRTREQQARDPVGCRTGAPQRIMRRIPADRTIRHSRLAGSCGRFYRPKNGDRTGGCRQAIRHKRGIPKSKKRRRGVVGRTCHRAGNYGTPKKAAGTYNVPQERYHIHKYARNCRSAFLKAGNS